MTHRQETILTLAGVSLSALIVGIMLERLIHRTPDACTAVVVVDGRARSCTGGRLVVAGDGPRPLAVCVCDADAGVDGGP